MYTGQVFSLILPWGLQTLGPSAFFIPVGEVWFPECMNILCAGETLNCEGTEFKGQTQSEV